MKQFKPNIKATGRTIQEEHSKYTYRSSNSEKQQEIHYEQYLKELDISKAISAKIIPVVEKFKKLGVHIDVKHLENKDEMRSMIQTEVQYEQNYFTVEFHYLHRLSAYSVNCYKHDSGSPQMFNTIEEAVEYYEKHITKILNLETGK